MQDSVPVGVSLPKKLMARIDMERGDVNRSRFLLRLVEKAYGIEDKGANRRA